MISTHTPPGDGLAAFYGWAKAIDGEVLVKFFNEMAKYADPGYQDRLNILGRKGQWVFNIVFSEKGGTTSLPTVSVTVAETFPGQTIYELTVPRPDRLEDETYAAMTTRWLQIAYSALVGFNVLAGNPFNFNVATPWFVDPDAVPSATPLVLQDDHGITNEVWRLPATTPWVGQLTSLQINTTAAIINSNGVRPTSTLTLPDENASAAVVQIRLTSVIGFTWANFWVTAGLVGGPPIGEDFCIVFSNNKAWIPGSTTPLTYTFVGILPITSGYITRVSLLPYALSDEALVALSLNPQ